MHDLGQTLRVTEQAPERRESTARLPLRLDDIDRRIVDALREDGRLSVRALAEQVHISRAAAHARVQRLERERVILGYQARIDQLYEGEQTGTHQIGE